MVVGELLQRVAGQTVDAGVADVKEMRRGRLDDHGAQRADVAAVLVIGILAARLRMQPGIGGLRARAAPRSHRPGFRGAVVVGQKSLDRRLRGDPADLAGRDAVGQHDGDALQAEQRLVRNQDAVKILIGFLAALIGKLPDRYFQLARHSGFRGNGPLPLRGETRSRKIKRQARGRRPRRGRSRRVARRAGFDVGRVQRQPGEGETADEVADHGRNLVPENIVPPGELAAEQQARREQEHVHDRMLEGHEEEQHDRHPHRDHLAADVGGDHRADHAGRDHPVAEHAADEQRQHAGRAVIGIADGAALADGADHLADLVGRRRETEGEDDRHHHRDREGAGKIADKTRPQLRSTPPSVTPGRLSISASGHRTKTPVSRSKPSR